MTRDSDQPAVAAVAGTDREAGTSGYAWVVLAVCFLITTLTYAGSYSFGLFFNPLRAEFGWSSAQTSGVFALFMFCYCIFGIFSGWAVDRIGPRITTIAGGLCLGLGFLLSGMVHELWQIYLSYGLLAGAGMSSVYGPVLTTASRWFRRRQGLALGLVSSGIGLGTFVGPPIFGHLIPAYGWRTSYLAAGICIGSIMMLLGLLLRKDPVQAAEGPEEKKDPGEEKKGGWTSDVDEWSVREVICTKPFWLYSAVYIMVGFGLQMMLAHMVPYMQETYRLTPSAAAAVFSVIGVASATGRLIMGGVSDYLGARKSLALSVVVEGVAVGFDRPFHASVDALSLWSAAWIRVWRSCPAVPGHHKAALRYETYGQEYRASADLLWNRRPPRPPSGRLDVRPYGKLRPSFRHSSRRADARRLAESHA